MSAEIRRQLHERGAVLEGHFELSSGRHSDTFIEKFRLLQWPDVTSTLCGQIADHHRDRVNLVAGPTTGGVILAFETARQLRTRCVIAERCEDGPGREFRRGFEVGAGDNVLIIDDVLTTGGSIRDVVDAVRVRGGNVVGVAVLIDRSAGRTSFGPPLFSCLSVDVASWDPDECRLCEEQVPLTIT